MEINLVREPGFSVYMCEPWVGGGVYLGLVGVCTLGWWVCEPWVGGGVYLGLVGV